MILEAGNKAPDFSLRTIDGSEMQLSEVVLKQPVVLVVLRGWPGYQCPVCTRQVGSLLNDAVKFSNLGVAVILVYPGPSRDMQKHAEEFSGEFKFPQDFYFTLDPDYSMINLYGLRWDALGETAYPSTFVLNKESKIVFAKISDTHGGRATNEEIFEALGNL